MQNFKIELKPQLNNNSSFTSKANSAMATPQTKKDNN